MIDLLSGPHFWIALGQIIAVNLALSGNNGVVIALAAHSLPFERRRRAILWGSLAAMAIRLALTVVAFEVLRLPYMKIVGGVLLFWIAVKLLVHDTHEDRNDAGDRSIFASAAYVIMLANLAMSLDNVLAIAAAAADNSMMLALGLVISIMFIGFGGNLVMAVVSRFPAIYTLCAALIGYLAGGMLIADMVIKDWTHGHLQWLQGIPLGQFEVSVPGLIGAASVFPLARLYEILRPAAGRRDGTQSHRSGSRVRDRLAVGFPHTRAIAVRGRGRSHLSRPPLVYALSATAVAADRVLRFETRDDAGRSDAYQRSSRLRYRRLGTRRQATADQRRGYPQRENGERLP